MRLSSAINGAGTKYSVVVFKAVGVISSKAREIVEYLGSGETYDKDVVAEDYNRVDNTTLAEDEAGNLIHKKPLCSNYGITAYRTYS